MNDYPKLKVGDEVLIQHSYSGVDSRPGKVVKVGRTLYQILEDRYADQPELAEPYRIDTRRKNDGYGRRRIETATDVAQRRRRSDALCLLLDLGVTFKSTTADDWSTDALALLAQAAAELRANDLPASARPA